MIKVVDAWYPVIGVSARELSESMALLGPLRNGRRYAAFTDWQVRWRFRAGGPPGCVKLEACEVDVEATVTLPRWRPLRAVEPELIQRWSRFTAALRVHEEGHLGVAERAGKEVLRVLGSLGACSSEEGWGELAERAAQAAVVRARDEEMAYDVETRNGAAQGATLDEGGAE